MFVKLYILNKNWFYNAALNYLYTNMSVTLQYDYIIQPLASIMNSIPTMTKQSRSREKKYIFSYH